MKHIISILIGGFCLVNCTQSIPLYYINEEAAYQSMSCRYDRFKKITSCQMPEIYNSMIAKNKKRENVVIGQYNGVTAFFRTFKTDAEFKDKSGKYKSFKTMQLYFSVMSSDWLFLNSAYDEHGTALPLIEIDKSVGRYGSVYEDVGITIDEEFLSKYCISGVTIQLSGRRGNVTFFVPPAYIMGFFKHVETK